VNGKQGATNQPLISSQASPPWVCLHSNELSVGEMDTTPQAKAGLPEAVPQLDLYSLNLAGREKETIQRKTFQTGGTSPVLSRDQIPMKQSQRKQADAQWTNRAPSLILFFVISVLPVLAGIKVVSIVPLHFVIAYLFLITGLTFVMYRSDKQKAKAGAWRIPESSLHLLELAGGWAAAFWAQRLYRHKVRKVSYQVTFWMIGGIHQFVALDFLFDWRYSLKMLEVVKGYFS